MPTTTSKSEKDPCERPPRLMQFQSQMATPRLNLFFHIQRKSTEVRQTLGDTAQAEPTPTIMPVLPIVVVDITVAGSRAPGRNRQRTVCRLKQNGLHSVMGTIRPKNQVSCGSFAKAVWKVDLGSDLIPTFFTVYTTTTNTTSSTTTISTIGNDIKDSKDAKQRYQM